MYIYLLLTYFGKFPNYFQLYLDSVGMNDDILKLILITDINTDNYVIPPNVIKINLSLDDVRKKASLFFLKEYNINIIYTELIKRSYLLCDYKIIYHILFYDDIQKYNLTSHDYIGWCDCDIIFGKISDFIGLNNDYSIIGYHGHFTAFKNIDLFRNLYRKINNIEKLLIEDKYNVCDEKHFREELFNLVSQDNSHKCYTMWKMFCDIIPFAYRQNIQNIEERKKLVMTTKKDKIIKYLSFDKNNKKLIIHFEDNNKMETVYIHLQKREMSINFNEYSNIFYIFQNSFELIDELN